MDYRSTSCLGEPTIDDFCSHLVETYTVEETQSVIDYQQLNVNTLIKEFRDFFSLEYPLPFEKLQDLCSQSNIALSAQENLPVGRGFNYMNLAECQHKVHILYEKNDAPTAQVHTTLHEIYEVIMHKLEQNNPQVPDLLKTDQESLADLFAAHVHLPLDQVNVWKERCNLDAVEIARFFGCSFTTALIQFKKSITQNLEKRVKDIPMISLNYELPYWENNESSEYRLTVFQTLGFNTLMTKEMAQNLVICLDEESQHPLSALTKRMDAFILKDIVLSAQGFTLNADLFVNPVRWRGYKSPLKMIFQIISSEHNATSRLSDDAPVYAEDLHKILNTKNITTPKSEHKNGYL